MLGARKPSRTATSPLPLSPAVHWVSSSLCATALPTMLNVCQSSELGDASFLTDAPFRASVI